MCVPTHAENAESQDRAKHITYLVTVTNCVWLRLLGINFGFDSRRRLTPVTRLVLSGKMASTLQSNQTERLNQIYNGLKNRSPEIRLQSAEELRRFVSVIAL